MFQIGDLCLAKLGKTVPWPAKIINKLSETKYEVYFFGYYNRAHLSANRLFAYTDANIRDKIPTFQIKKNDKLSRALWEIKNDPDLFLDARDKLRINELTAKINALELKLNRCSFKMNTSMYLCVNLSKYNACPVEKELVSQCTISNMKCNDWNAEYQLYEVIQLKIASLKEKIESIKLNSVNKPTEPYKPLETVKFFVGDLVLAKRVKTRPYWPGRIVSISNNNYKIYFYTKKCNLILSREQIHKFSKEKIRNLLIKNCSKDLRKAVNEIEKDNKVELSVREKQLLESLRTRFSVLKPQQTNCKLQIKKSKPQKQTTSNKMRQTNSDGLKQLEMLQNELKELKQMKTKKLRTIEAQYNMKITKLEKRIKLMETDQKKSSFSEDQQSEEESEEEDANNGDDQSNVAYWCRDEELKRKVESQFNTKIDHIKYFRASRPETINLQELFNV